jgi:hypothetical protein
MPGTRPGMTVESLHIPSSWPGMTKECAAAPRGRDAGTENTLRRCLSNKGRQLMGRGILLWLLGIPIPIIILLLLFWH